MSYFDLCLEIIGTISFAISGAVTGLEKKMDIFGISTLGVITAVGGGVMRDIILGITPPTAFCDPKYAIIAIITSLIVFVGFARKLLNSKYGWFQNILLFSDAIGLGIFTVHGAEIAVDLGFKENFFLVLFVAVLTGVGGGVLRDLLSGERPYIFMKHIYACAAIVGAVGYILLCLLVSVHISTFISCVIIVAIRIFSAKFRWNLPRLSRET